jgi:hypothetical protein
MTDSIKLVHENKTFSEETVYLSGGAFMGCTFDRCTLVVHDFEFVFSNCKAKACIWHLNLVVHDHRTWKEFLEGVAQKIHQSLPRTHGEITHEEKTPPDE